MRPTPAPRKEDIENPYAVCIRADRIEKAIFAITKDRAGRHIDDGLITYAEIGRASGVDFGKLGRVRKEIGSDRTGVRIDPKLLRRIGISAVRHRTATAM